ncbi:hypothetical protein [Mucilaginibacter sp. 44-25]|uniref:hypothetical protein n=1 Tax=Mucilaginibacter sp. 44-25 TaxID=1895794 RepID=UPI00095B648B|nr:hypothetical protein [Mucilaginibacter sp. 44-25]OJW17274.1 MAG: hypothetical protein BGO48_06880 [Mucilaginibacter sp. 44-25]
MKGYFGPGVTCIYLDQFATSNLLDTPANKTWEEMTKLLQAKSAAGRIICPVPPEHFLESANKKHENAMAMDKRFAALARGLAFKPEAFVTAEHIISLLRNTPLDQNTFCDRLARPDTLTNNKIYDDFKARHTLLNSQVTEITAGQNEIRKITAQKRFSPATMAPFVQFIKAREIKPFIDLLDEVIGKGGFVSKGVKFATREVIHWADYVMQILMAHHQLGIWEAVFLKDIITRTGFDRIPSLDIRVSLTANLAVEHKKETVNDQIDIMRLATGLPPADLLFTDRQRKFELQQTGLAEKYKTKVFCGVKEDLEVFYQALLEV